MATEIRDDYATPEDWYDPREDECPDCGFDIPSGCCECRWDSMTGTMIVGGVADECAEAQ